MAENQNPASEPLQKSAQTAGMVRGAVKTGKAIAGAAKGAAGGPYGIAAGFIWGSRKTIGKIVIVIVSLLMIPILFICMLPALIFGGLVNAFSPDNPEVPILNDSAAITENLTDISTSISIVLSESMADTLADIDADFASSGADQMEIINPYENSPNYNANAFVKSYPTAYAPTAG